MIEKLYLKNFQAHKNTELNFSPGLNVIVGNSDQGKSSIIRALYWTFFNQPSGNEFINRKAKYCSVKIVSNGKTIERYRDKSKNRYVINNENFDAVRTDVPNEVKEILNIQPVNVQLQDDPYFLLSSQPGEVAKNLNKVVGLNQIDSSLKYVNSLLRKETASINHINEFIEEKEKELNKYSGIEEIERKNSRYETIKKKIKKFQYNSKRLEQCISLMEKYLSVLECEKNITKATDLMNNWIELEDESKEIQNKIKRIITTINRLEKANQTVEKLSPKKEQINYFLKSIEKHKDKSKDIPTSKLSKLIQSIEQQQKAMDQAEIKQGEALKKLEDFKLRIEICPLCEQKLV